MGVGSDLSQDRGVAFDLAGLQEVCDALQEEHVVMVVWGPGKSRALVVEPNGLDAGEGVRKDSQP